MTDTEFKTWQAKRKRWMLLLDTTEMFLLLVAFFWGAQLVFVGHLTDIAGEPIAVSLRELAPFMPITCHGYGLMLVAALHLYAMGVNHPGCRRWCIVGQAGFFSFVWWALVLRHLVVPGVWTLPIFVLACVINYLSLVRPTDKR